MALIMNDFVVGQIAETTPKSHPHHKEIVAISNASRSFTKKLTKRLENADNLTYDERKALQGFEDVVRTLFEMEDE